MQQISNYVYCDDFIASLPLECRLIAHPYHDLPYLLIKGFLSPDHASSLARHTYQSDQNTLAQVRTAKQGFIQSDVVTSIRKTTIHELSPLLLKHYVERFSHYQDTIERFFGVALTTATNVQALGYYAGDYYVKHADDSSELIGHDGRCVGFKRIAPNRKITTVLFASSYTDDPKDMTQYSGGELCFNYLFNVDAQMLQLRPEAGDLIAFPSNPIFSHEVLPVRAGYRLSLVQWHNAHTT